MSRVIETLKASRHEVTLVLKVSTRHSETRGDFPDAPLNCKEGGVQDGDGDHLHPTRTVMSPQSDSGVGPPPHFTLDRNPGMDVKRTVSTPITDGERALALEISTPQGEDPAPLLGEEDTDGGSRNIGVCLSSSLMFSTLLPSNLLRFTDHCPPADSSGRGHSKSFEERLEQRTNGDGGMQKVGVANGRGSCRL